MKYKKYKKLFVGLSLCIGLAAFGLAACNDDDGSGKLVRIHREELDIEGESTEVSALHGVLEALR